MNCIGLPCAKFSAAATMTTNARQSTDPSSSSQAQQEEESITSRAIAKMLAAAKITDPEVVRQLMQMPNIPEEENWSCAPHKRYPVGKEMNLYQAGKMAQFVLGMTAKVGRKEVSVQNEKRRVKRNAKYLAYLEKELRSDMQ